MGRLLFRFVVLGAIAFGLGCGSRQPAAGDAPEPLSDASVSAAASAEGDLPPLTLEPWPPGQLDEWRFNNGSDIPICGVSKINSYGDANIEFAEWPGVRFPTVCGDASSRIVGSIQPGQSKIVHSDLRDGLPSGSYRMVVELRDCQFEKDPDTGSGEFDPRMHFVPQYRLVVDFAVSGYDGSEADAIFEMLSEPSIQKCEDAFALVIRHLKKYLLREHVTKAFALQNLTFTQRTAAIELLYQGRLFDQLGDLIDGRYGPDWALPAAAAVLDGGCYRDPAARDGEGGLSPLCEKALNYILAPEHKSEVKRDLKKGTLACAEKTKRTGDQAECDPFGRTQIEKKGGLTYLVSPRELTESDLSDECSAVYQGLKDRLRFYADPSQKLEFQPSVVEEVR